MAETTNMLGAEELVNKLTLETVNIFYLNGNPDDPEVSKLEATIALVAEAWNLPQSVIEKSRDTIAAEREVTLRLKTGEQVEGVVPKEEILSSDSGNEIMAVLWTLFETAVRLDTQDKRKQTLQSAHFLKGDGTIHL